MEGTNAPSTLENKTWTTSSAGIMEGRYLFGEKPVFLDLCLPVNPSCGSEWQVWRVELGLKDKYYSVVCRTFEVQ